MSLTKQKEGRRIERVKSKVHASEPSSGGCVNIISVIVDLNLVRILHFSRTGQRRRLKDSDRNK
jgi:hypothetical protein